MSSLRRGVTRNAETDCEWDPIAMSEDYQLRNVGTVAGIIGGVVLLLGLVGVVLNLIL